MATLVWTFHGPRAAGIAEHHGKHLEEFAHREKLGDVTVDVASDAGTATVRMVVDDTVADAVVAALRPHRRE